MHRVAFEAESATVPSHRPALAVAGRDSGAAQRLPRRQCRYPQYAAKMALDKSGAILLLLAAGPLLAAIALTIAMDSPGPILFRQQRTGRRRQTFTILKFRTMTAAPSGPARQTVRNDPRCTRIGRFLRRSSLDELPQLWNVVRGDMSLVGPRPHAEDLHAGDHAEGLTGTLYAMRYEMRPGLTGWAQIHGYRGAIQSPEDLQRRLEHDIFYVQQWTLWLDFRILARTPAAILGGQNAF